MTELARKSLPFVLRGFRETPVASCAECVLRVVEQQISLVLGPSSRRRARQEGFYRRCKVHHLRWGDVALVITSSYAAVLAQCLDEGEARCPEAI